MKYKLILGLLFFAATCMSQKVTNVTHVAYTVSDTESAVTFLEKNVDAEVNYTKEISGIELQRLFGIRDQSLSLQLTSVAIGSNELRLLEFESELPSREIPFDSKSNDLWFQHIAIVVDDMHPAYKQVHDNKVEHVSTAPQTLPDYIPAAAGISAFYFRDKDDHNLELIYFPEGKGNPKWKKETDDMFLGIDHTAIGISDTDVSLDFYQDVLGLQVAGNSENYGPEQEHLNQVFGARLLITGLHAAMGFGVEFLEYIAPPGGKPYPEDSTPLDHWYWHTAMEVDDLSGLIDKIENENYEIVSSGIVAIEELDYMKSVIVRDPDGHAVLLFERKN